jgi:hypothetical protein
MLTLPAELLPLIVEFAPLFGSSGIAVKAPNILCHQRAKAS